MPHLVPKIPPFLRWIWYCIVLHGPLHIAHCTTLHITLHGTLHYSTIVLILITVAGHCIAEALNTEHCTAPLLHSYADFRHCTAVLHCIILHCIIQQCTLHHTTLHNTSLHSITIPYTVQRYIALHHSTFHAFPISIVSQFNQC